MFEENATAVMLILMSSTGRGTIHFVGSEEHWQVWKLEFGKFWTKL